MRDKNVFEKARMNGVLIPLAGFIGAAALILAVIITAACFGAFTGISDKAPEKTADFEKPEIPEYDHVLETVNENPESEAAIQIIEFSFSDDGNVSYKLKLVNDGGAAAKIKDVRCMIYEKEKCIKSSTLAGDLTLEGGSFIELSGSDEAKSADAVIFYASWEDRYGAAADTYTVCKK